MVSSPTSSPDLLREVLCPFHRAAMHKSCHCVLSFLSPSEPGSRHLLLELGGALRTSLRMPEVVAPPFSPAQPGCLGAEPQTKPRSGSAPRARPAETVAGPSATGRWRGLGNAWNGEEEGLGLCAGSSTPPAWLQCSRPLLRPDPPSSPPPAPSKGKGRPVGQGRKPRKRVLDQSGK